MHALLIWALFLGVLYAHGQSPGGQSKPRGEPAHITLTNDQPTGSFPLNPETLASAPSVLTITLTEVVNPDKLPFQIFVYLSYHSQSGEEVSTVEKKILIGNFGLYPPDHPASFHVRSSTAFRALKSSGSKPSEVRLLLEMRRIHETSPWTPVEATVAPPEWQRK